MIQQCFACHAAFPLDQVIYNCDRCGGNLEVILDDIKVKEAPFEGRGVWRYAAFLPGDRSTAVTLREGDTSLHRCDRLSGELGVPELYLKNEGDNPTGSFKDRGMTVGLSWAVQIGARAVVCASTGNTSASMAAYAAKAGLRAIVLIPGGKVAVGKLAQAVAHGAEVVQVQGSFDDAMRLVHELSLSTGDVYMLNSINPFRLEGQKTLAFELFESLGRCPDAVVLPMGNAGNISAIWKGFREMKAAGMIDRLPRMIGVQAAGAAPIVNFLARPGTDCRVESPETIATAIRIGAPVNWRKALAAIGESGGTAGAVTDEEIIDAQRDLARREGLFVEPASAAPIAWLRRNPMKAVTVVCVATGHGLKDPDAVLKSFPKLLHVRPTMDSLQHALKIG